MQGLFEDKASFYCCKSRRLFVLVLALLILVGITACAGPGNSGSNTYTSASSDSGALTNEKAQRALSQWMPNCNATVVGIQEMPQQNAAKANLTFSNCVFPYHGPNIQPGEKNYSGHGEAVFTHYNDGRWVLTEVSAMDGWPPFKWENMSIEAR